MALSMSSAVAMRMLEQGVATAEDIDKAMELGYNHPMGPLKLTDLVGLDVRLAIAEYLYRTLEEPQFEPPAILREKVAKGELGKKTGKGFYRWGTSIGPRRAPYRLQHSTHVPEQIVGPAVCVAMAVWSSDPVFPGWSSLYVMDAAPVVGDTAMPK